MRKTVRKQRARVTFTRRSAPKRQQIAAWLVHLFTASGAVLGLFALYAISLGQWRLSFGLMAAAVVVDSVDGTLARRFHTRLWAGSLDGALLDNLIDYLNYVIVPCFFLLQSDLLAPAWRAPVAGVIVLASAYQFCQQDAKTADHFFKGFPCYWNIAVFYLFLWRFSPSVNAAVLLFLAALVFVPIKYVYPSRMEYVTHRVVLRRGLLGLTVLWGLGSAWQLIDYPASHQGVTAFLVGYMVVYLFVSVYRMLVPLDGEAVHAHQQAVPVLAEGEVDASRL